MHNIKIIRTMDEVNALKSEWHALWINSAAKTPYQRWEWNYSWIKGTGQEKSLYIFTIRNKKSELIGIAPFKKTTFLGLFKVLSFIGQETSSYPDFIVRGGQSSIVIRAFFQYIKERHDIMGLDLKICEPSPSIGILREILQNVKWRKTVAEPYTTRLLVNFGDDYEKYLAVLSHDMRYAIRASVRKLNQQFEVKFCTTDDSARDFDRRMKTLFNLNALRWGGDPLISHPGYKNYYRASRDPGCSKIFTLSCNDVIVGAVGTSLMDNTIFAEVTGFDFSISKVDLGKVFYEYLFRWAVENKFTKLDFITGMEPYKLRYKPQELCKWRITTFKKTSAHNIVASYWWLSSQKDVMKQRLVKSWLFQSTGLYRLYKMATRRKLLT